MKKIKTEFVVIGNGGAALLAASRLIELGKSFILINPQKEFSLGDLYPRHGMGLWNLSYFNRMSLPEIYDLTLQRLRDIFPGSVERTQFSKGEGWSILSSTPIHREKSEDLEREFFKMEKHPYTAGQFRLTSADQVHALGKRYGLQFEKVAQIDGGVMRSYVVNWDPVETLIQSVQYLTSKFPESIYLDASIKGRFGKQIVIQNAQAEECTIEAENSILIFITGELLGDLKTIIAGCDEGWIQGMRKRLRERSFAWFLNKRQIVKSDWNNLSDGVWIEMGPTHYLWNDVGGYASWTTRKGPDGLERVIDEAMRLRGVAHPDNKFVKESRHFWLEWEWRQPSWRKTKFDTHWATSFEGDLPAILEMLWKIPNT